MRVLFTGHTSVIGGAERCLLDLLGHVGDEIDPYYAGPPGPMMDVVRSMGVPVSSLRGTTGSLRLDRATPGVIGDLALDGLEISRLAGRTGADVVMANSLRAGLMGVVAERIPGSVPQVVHVHDVLPEGAVAAGTNALIRRGTTRAVANSQYVADRFAANGDRVDIVYNPIDLDRFDPRTVDAAQARSDLGVTAAARLVGVVAQITPWKAQIDAIRAHALLLREVPAARLLIGGTTKFLTPGTRYDNGAYLAELHAEVARLDCGDSVSFLGEHADVPRLVRALDVLVMPSWEEPFGRVAVEAMAMGTAVVVTNVGGPPEYVEHGVTGLLVAPRQPSALARETGRLLFDDAFRARIGAAGQQAARARFGVADYRRRMLEAFERALTAAPRRARRPLVRR